MYGRCVGELQVATEIFPHLRDKFKGVVFVPDLQGLVGLDRSGIQKYGSGGIQKVGGMKTGIDLKSHVDQKWYEQRMKYQITVGGQKVESRKVKISFAVMPGYQ